MKKTNWEKKFEKATRLRLAGFMAGLISLTAIQASKDEFESLIDAFIKGNTAFVKNLLQEVGPKEK